MIRVKKKKEMEGTKKKEDRLYHRKKRTFRENTAEILYIEQGMTSGQGLCCPEI